MRSSIGSFHLMAIVDNNSCDAHSLGARIEHIVQIFFSTKLKALENGGQILIVLGGAW